MKSTVLFGFLGIAALLLGASCSHNPESFCQSWVESTCQAVTGCCQSGTTFDAHECRLSLSQVCQQTTAVDKVQAGEVKFDSGAANTCFGNVMSCADLHTSGAPDTYARVQACANMVTGYRPVGTACTSPTDCQKTGDFATCYDGTMGATAGVCAKVVLDNTSCSFTFASSELHVCPDGMFCDRASFKPNPSDPPSTRAFEFSASCKPDVALGGDCASTMGQPLPCAKGLFCQPTGPAKATCAQRKSAGAACQAPNECADGLACTPGGTGATCQTQTVAFCFNPTVCGDGVCQPPETKQTCPQDCGGTCGDGICQPPETKQSCPQDCGGGACASSCAAAISNGSTVCPGSGSAKAAFNALVSCATANCPTECAGQFGAGMGGVSAACGSCLQASCPTETQTCANN